MVTVHGANIFPLFVNLRHAGETPDPQRWPKLARYLASMHGRPSFKAVIEEEEAGLKKAK
jgi:glutathione S-transferase